VNTSVLTEEFCLLGYDAMLSKLCSLPPAFTLVSCSDYSSILKLEAICSSETSVNVQRTTSCYFPGDRTLHNHRCENLKSYILTDTFIGSSGRNYIFK
jgi:hypothetical protein